MDILHNRPEEISRNWGWFLALSILLFALGALALSAVIYTTIISVFFLGVLLLVAGLAQCVMAIRSPQWSGFFLNLLSGLLSMVLGYLFLQTPGVSAITITLLMAAFFLVSGLFKIFTSVSHRFHQWGWVLGSGIASLLLGVLLWVQWPVSGLWAIGLFLGIDLVMAAGSWLIIALNLRKFHTGGRRGGLAHF